MSGMLSSEGRGRSLQPYRCPDSPHPLTHTPLPFRKTIALRRMLFGPSRKEPVFVTICVDPKPLIETESGERFVCDVSLDVQPAGSGMLSEMTPAIEDAYPFQLDWSAGSERTLVDEMSGSSGSGGRTVEMFDSPLTSGRRTEPSPETQGRYYRPHPRMPGYIGETYTEPPPIRRPLIGRPDYFSSYSAPEQRYRSEMSRQTAMSDYYGSSPGPHGASAYTRREQPPEMIHPAILRRRRRVDKRYNVPAPGSADLYTPREEPRNVWSRKRLWSPTYPPEDIRSPVTSPPHWSNRSIEWEHPDPPPVSEPSDRSYSPHLDSRPPPQQIPEIQYQSPDESDESISPSPESGSSSGSGVPEDWYRNYLARMGVGTPVRKDARYDS